MKSKFLYQDVDVVSLADKGIVVRCFVCRNYDKVLMETGTFCDNIRVTKMDSCLVLTECLSRRILRLSTSPIDLIHSERVSSSTFSFFAHRFSNGTFRKSVNQTFFRNKVRYQKRFHTHCDILIYNVILF